MICTWSLVCVSRSSVYFVDWELNERLCVEVQSTPRISVVCFYIPWRLLRIYWVVGWSIEQFRVLFSSVEKTLDVDWQLIEFFLVEIKSNPLFSVIKKLHTNEWFYREIYSFLWSVEKTIEVYWESTEWLFVGIQSSLCFSVICFQNPRMLTGINWVIVGRNTEQSTFPCHLFPKSPDVWVIVSRNTEQFRVLIELSTISQMFIGN